MGKHEHFKVQGFWDFLLEVEIHVVPNTWEKWVSIIWENYGKTQTFQIYGFLKNYKTTEYLRMKGVLDFIELRMLRRADYLRKRNILGDSDVYSYGMPSVFHIGRENGWADSLFSFGFATRWNPKHPSYVSTRLFCNSISQQTT